MRTIVSLLLTTVLLSSLSTGCLSRRTRLTQERSALLQEREQLQQPWELPKSNGRFVEEEQPTQTSKSQRLQKIDERVAEIDVELLR